MHTLSLFRKPLLQNLAGILVLFALIALCRYVSGGINRPIEQDELVTLKYYTSVPYTFNSAEDKF